MIRVAVMGYGTVGAGVVEILLKRKGQFGTLIGDEIELAAVLDVRAFDDMPPSAHLTHNFEDILSDDSISIVVETIGGTGIACDFVRRLLSAGKHVVTSNKALVVDSGEEFLRIARENDVNFLYEASVGGGIPILRPLAQCLIANEITSVCGILNGTTNFILTAMFKDGVSMQDALKAAQALGYAEGKPDDDICGFDARRKLAILAHLAFGARMSDASNIPCVGITGITEGDIALAAKMGGRVKLIAYASRCEGGWSGWVQPAIVPQDSMLYGVNDVYNAVIVDGDAVGELMFYGQGAGRMPTASAVCADVIDAAKHLRSPKRVAVEDNAPKAQVESLGGTFAMRITGARAGEWLDALGARIPPLTYVAVGGGTFGAIWEDAPGCPTLAQIENEATHRECTLGTPLRVLK